MIKEKIISEIEKSLEKSFGVKEENIFLERPNEEKFGEYACNVAMILSKKLKKNPREIAESLVKNFEKIEEVEKIEIAGPGFINFTLSNFFWSRFLDEVLEKSEDFGRGTAKNKKVNIEFISCNPTGPMTIANGRGGFTGDVLANIMEFSGFEVEREFFANDAGNQVLNLGKSVLAIRGEIEKEENFYSGEYLKIFSEKHKDKKDAKELGYKIADEIMNELIKPTIEKMGINFDIFFSERKMREEKKIEKAISFFEEKKLTYKKDGALFMKTSEFGDDKDRVLKKSDGNFTYFAADTAYHFDKFSRNDLLINIWGADHHGYVPRIKAFSELIERKEDLKFIIMQLVRLVSEGKEVKMSKRKGVYYEISDLIEEVGVESARWFFLEKSSNTHLDFDLDLAKDRSEKNPVYYVKYAHARICGIIRRLDEEKKKENIDGKQIFDEYEILLLREILKFPEIIEDIYKTQEVHKICFYAHKLAEKFHKFYSHCRVLDSEENDRKRREKILIASKQVLTKSLNLMGIEAPERM